MKITITENNYEALQSGKTLLIKNYKTRNSNIVINKNTKVYKVAPFQNIKEEMITTAKNLINPQSITMTTQQALNNTTRDFKTVTGYIVQVG